MPIPFLGLTKKADSNSNDASHVIAKISAVLSRNLDQTNDTFGQESLTKTLLHSTHNKIKWYDF